MNPLPSAFCVRWFHLAVLLFLFLPMARSHAHLAPTPEQIAKLKQMGKWDAAMEFHDALGHHRMDPGLMAKAKQKVNKAKLESEGKSLAEIESELRHRQTREVPPRWRGVPTVGAVRTVTLLIDFADLRAAQLMPQLTPDRVAQNIYGPGTEAARQFAPFESVNAYLKRSSHGKLDWKGDVLGYYNMPRNRASYAPPGNDNTVNNQAIFSVVREVLQSYDAQVNFAQYDNNNDGVIDNINIMWTGDPGEWLSFWWAYQWSFFTSEAVNYRIDGKSIRKFTWQPLYTRANKTDFNPVTMIHETGHVLGLPDLYDYKQSEPLGQKGGVGRLDMMHGNIGNYNAFFRWMMEWIQPRVIGTGAPAEVALSASGDTVTDADKAVLVFPSARDTPFQEFFMLENRFRTGNDGGESRLPADGLVIWHVDATLSADGADYVADNTNRNLQQGQQGRKLVRLIQADGRQDIEMQTQQFTGGTSYGGNVDAGDYYTQGKSFGPTTNPASTAYNSGATGVTVDTISSAGMTMTARVGFPGAGTTTAADLRDQGAGAHALSLTTAEAGAPLTISGQVTNGGTAAAGAFRVNFYASANQTIELGVDTLLGSRDIPGLAQGATVPVNQTVSLPDAIQPGLYFIGWVIDAQNMVTELTENNNSVVIKTPQLTVTGTAQPEISVRGRGQEIPNRTTQTTDTNDTAFGGARVGTTVQRVFTIANAGGAELTLGAGPVTLSGAGATSFRVAAQPAGPIPAGASTDFAIVFQPGAAGLATVDVSIASNDADENPSTFRITAQGQNTTDDHTNEIATATPLPTGTPVGGVLDAGGDVDLFRITLNAVGLLQAFASGTVDTAAYLLQADGSRIAFDDDGGADRNFLIQAALAPGTYYLAVSGYNDTVAGAYTVQAMFTAGNQDDHANTPAATTSGLTPGQSVAGTLESGGDVDVFRLALTQAGVIIFDSEGNTNTAAGLLNAAGTILAQADQGGQGQNFRLERYVEPGTYYLAVRGGSADALGAYVIRSVFQPGLPPDDHGNTLDRASSLASGESDGIFEFPNDVDVFFLRLDGPGYLAVYSGGKLDTVVTVYDSLGQQIGADDDSGPGIGQFAKNFQIDGVLSAGTYYFAVSGYDAAVVGDYKLYATFTPDYVGPPDDFGDLPEQGTPILSGAAGLTEGLLEASGDADFFKITVTQPGYIEVLTSGSTDTSGVLYSPLGVKIEADDDSGSSTNFLLPAAVSPGTYYVRVTGYYDEDTEEFESGPYSVSWAFTPGAVPDDFGNTLAAAAVQTVPGTRDGKLEVRGDTDVFRVQLASSGRLRAFTEGVTDTFGELLNADGAQLLSVDDTEQTANFDMEQELSAGTYYIRVRGYDLGVVGAYTLKLEFTATAAAAPVVGLGSTNVIVALALAGQTQTSFQLRNAGGGILNYTLSSTQPWLVPAVFSGSSTGEWDTVALSVNAVTLPAGTSNATVNITAPGAVASSLTVSVTVADIDTRSGSGPELGIGFTSATLLQLSWQGEAGVTWRAEASTTLAPSSWSPVPGTSTTVGAVRGSVQVQVTSDKPKQFFRLVRQ